MPIGHFFCLHAIFVMYNDRRNEYAASRFKNTARIYSRGYEMEVEPIVLMALTMLSREQCCRERESIYPQWQPHLQKTIENGDHNA